MSANVLDVQNKISEIENAIRHRDVNAGIGGYNALRMYAGDPSLDFQTRKLAHDKGMELYTILAQMRQEILRNEQIQTSNIRAPQPTYADPVPLKGIKENFSTPSKINFKTIFLIILIIGFIGAGTYYFMTGNTGAKGCTVDGPFACKEVELKSSSSTDTLGQNYVILKLDPSKGIVSQINVSGTSESLKGCDRIYIDRAHSLATNFEEIKVMFDCKNLTIADVAGAVTLSYKLDGVEQTSTIQLSTSGPVDTTTITPTRSNTTNSNINNTGSTPTPTGTTNTTSNTSRNITTNASRTNTTSTISYSRGGGGGGGGGSSITYTIDETPPIMTLEVYSYSTTLNSGGTTFNMTFKSTGHANYLKNMAYITFNIGGNTSTCTNTSHLAVCYYTFPCPISWMGLNKTYSAQGFDDNDFDATKSSTFIVPDFIVPSATISTINTTNFTTTPVNMTGTASDNFLLSLVEYRLNNETWHTTNGTTSWNITANVRNGSNLLEIRTTDSFSNVNTTNKSFTATLRPEIDLVIYNNSDLNTNWTNASYNGTVNLSDDTIIKDGPYAISFNGNETGALILNMTNYTINNVDGYNNLSFWINGTNDTALKIRVRGDASDSLYPDVNLTNLTGEWTLTEINITQLNPNRQTISKIEIIPTSIPAGETNITFYIESLKWNGKITETMGPQIGVIYPTNNTMINITVGANTKNITISGNVSDDTYVDSVIVQINDNTTIYNMTAINFTTINNVTHNWSGTITLVNDTYNIINITAYDIYGKSTIYTINITLNITPDVTSPAVMLSAMGLLSGNQTNQTIVTINGTASEEANGTGLNYTAWRINNGPWYNTSNASIWSQGILLITDTNFIEVKSVDNSGNSNTTNMTIYYNYSTMNAEPFIIYDNDNFTYNWSYENASTNVSVTINDTNIIYSGNSSIKVNANANSTFNIMIGNTTDAGVNATNYTKVRFTIYANQSISNLYIKLGFVNDTNITYFGNTSVSIPATNWTIVNASVTTLMAGNSTFNSLGLTISESINVTYYLDNVQIVP